MNDKIKDAQQAVLSLAKQWACCYFYGNDPQGYKKLSEELRSAVDVLINEEEDELRFADL